MYTPKGWHRQTKAQVRNQVLYKKLPNHFQLTYTGLVYMFPFRWATTSTPCGAHTLIGTATQLHTLPHHYSLPKSWSRRLIIRTYDVLKSPYPWILSKNLIWCSKVHHPEKNSPNLCSLIADISCFFQYSSHHCNNSSHRKCIQCFVSVDSLSLHRWWNSLGGAQVPIVSISLHNYCTACLMCESACSWQPALVNSVQESLQTW